MSNNMLSPFHIHNLKSSSQASADQGSLVQISARGYDTTISDNPAAKLKYKDEDEDTIILGSSRELIDKLKEPVQQPSRGPTRKSKDRMSIAMLLSQQNPEESLKHHVFTIDEREEIQKLWQQVQQRNKVPKPPLIGPELPFRWSKADEAQLAEFCDEGMDLEEIMAKMDHHSVQSCRWHYRNHMENKKMQDEASRNKVASAYVRLRKAIWMPVAAEAGISWEEAESMHWAMGKDEISMRADDALPMDEAASVDLMSVISTDGDWHESRQPKVPMPSRSLYAPKFDDYRKHHFETTMPPQLQSHIPTTQAFKTVSSKLKSTASLPLMNPTPAVNLTVEGKRQAQAAGEILRARSTTSRHRRAMMSATDHTSHQNRWAGYTPSDAVSSRFPADVPQGFQKLTLTPEGKRQAQAAGDKLRCRTNPIRHFRPSRSGSLENGVNKNRWSTYAPRVARFEDRYHADTETNEKSEPKDTEVKATANPPTLLEVFEAELAKTPLCVNDVHDEAQFPDPGISDIPPLAEHPASAAKSNGGTPAPVSSAPSSPRPNALFSGFKMISDRLQGIAGGDMEPPHGLTHILENGFRTAAGGFEDFLKGLTGGLQELSDHTQRAADRTQGLDTRGIDDAIKDLQDFVVGLTNGLGAPHIDGTKEDQKAPATTDQSTSPTQPVHNNIDELLHDKSLHLPAGSSITSIQHPQQHAVDVDATAETKDIMPGDPSKSVLKSSSEVSHRPAAQTKHGASSDHGDTTSAPEFHEPGPIHLPQYPASPMSSLSNVTNVPAVGPGNVDDLHRSQTNQYLGEAPRNRTTSPPPAASRFPTLAQFEEGQRSTSTSTPSFPALPSMETLTPQRVGAPFTVAMAPPQAHPLSYDAWRSSQYALQDYQMQLKLLEQQKRLHMAQQEQEALSKSIIPPADIRRQRTENDRYNKIKQQSIRRQLVAQQKNMLKSSRLMTDPSVEHAQHEVMDNFAPVIPFPAPRETSEDQDQVHNTSPGTAARLAEPFDPLEVEPSAQPHMTEGIRRNATLASTSSRHNLPRRRPYSEAYDGLGRIAWDSFLGADRHEGQNSPKKTTVNLIKRQEHARKARESDRHHRKQEQLRRSATIQSTTNGSMPTFKRYDDEHQAGMTIGATLRKGANRSTPTMRRNDDGQQDNSTDGAVGRCVDQLRDLGFGDDDGSCDRLLIYAQAARGDLVEAIDMIDEEQRVYQGMS